MKTMGHPPGALRLLESATEGEIAVANCVRRVLERVTPRALLAEQWHTELPVGASLVSLPWLRPCPTKGVKKAR